MKPLIIYLFLAGTIAICWSNQLYGPPRPNWQQPEFLIRNPSYAGNYPSLDDYASGQIYGNRIKGPGADYNLDGTFWQPESEDYGLDELGNQERQLGLGLLFNLFGGSGTGNLFRPFRGRLRGTVFTTATLTITKTNLCISSKFFQDSFAASSVCKRKKREDAKVIDMLNDEPTRVQQQAASTILSSLLPESPHQLRAVIDDDESTGIEGSLSEKVHGKLPELMMKSSLREQRQLVGPRKTTTVTFFSIVTVTIKKPINIGGTAVVTTTTPTTTTTQPIATDSTLSSTSTQTTQSTVADTTTPQPTTTTQATAAAGLSCRPFFAIIC